MDFRNATDLDGGRLQRLFERHAWPYRHEKLVVRVRYSRGADFSGTCYYTQARIFVNLGRHVVYPYLLRVQVARPQSNRTHWWREVFRLSVADAYQLALFVFLHEFYHYLIKQAGRGRQRREAVCDRFATRALPAADPSPAAGGISATSTGWSPPRRRPACRGCSSAARVVKSL
jgi:hypothetical protein